MVFWNKYEEFRSYQFETQICTLFALMADTMLPTYDLHYSIIHTA